MGCGKSKDNNVGQPQLPQPPMPPPRTWSERIRAGEVNDQVDSAEFENMLPHLFAINNEQNQENEDQLNVFENDHPFEELKQESGGFDAVIQRINLKKAEFYKKMGRSPTVMSSGKNMSTDEKIQTLHDNLNIYKISFTQGANVLLIDRENVFDDSFGQFMGMQHQKELKIVFKGETSTSGQDAGGMEKEWFNLISEEFLNPDNGMFRESSTDEISYVIDESSSEIENSSKKFEFFGQVLAKAIFDEIPLNLCLNTLTYRLILNPEAEITFEDLEVFDSSVFKSLEYILDNDVEEDEYMEMYFTHEHEGEMHDLVPDGGNILVTNENKLSYVKLKSEFMIRHFILPQLKSIRTGFERLIPLNSVRSFNEDEFKLLICGQDEIDLDDWVAHTRYEGDYTEDHQVIKWFWDYMQECEQEHLQIIFQFVTGMSRTPAGGFDALNLNRGEKQDFTIRSIEYDEGNPMPKAFTCFNRLHLPKYEDEEELKEKLDLIIERNEIYGFGLEN